MTVGVIHKRSAVLPSCYIGTRAVGGGKFQVGVNPSTKLPIIRSKDAGRVWTVSWDALCALAIAEGILVDPDGPAEDDGAPARARCAPPRGSRGRNPC